MSLINDVLRDLDKRRAEAPALRQKAPAQAEGPAGIGLRRPLSVGVAAVAIAVALAWWLLPGNDRATGTTVGEAIQTIDMPAPEAPVPAPMQPAPEPVVLAAVQESPAPAIEASEPSPATRSQPGAADDPSDGAGSGPITAAEPAPERETPEPQPDPLASIAPTSQPAPPTRPDAAVEPANEETTDGQISIRRADRPDAERDPFGEARRALGRGQHSLAEDRLRGLLIGQPDHVEARHLLATVLASTGRGPDAIDLLEQGLEHHSSPDLAGLLGRLLAERGETGRALAVLNAHAPDIDSEPDYHLLHAALLRQAGDHAAARDRYLAITRTVPTSAAAWIGLAASHESLGDTEAARAAYRQALRHDQAELAGFARGRLRALN
ncbi:MAG: hypothetical protein EA419_06435 [Wenzhouxiangella sp.]|nr:MAG: hypothetical protein EA419_06435 [Wenzhouxiangella sp.]